MHEQARAHGVGLPEHPPPPSTGVDVGDQPGPSHLARHALTVLLVDGHHQRVVAGGRQCLQGVEVEGQSVQQGVRQTRRALTWPAARASGALMSCPGW